MGSSSSAVVAAGNGQRKKRQKRSVAEKRGIVEEALLPGASIARTAREHGVNANQVYAWRTQYLAGKLMDKRSSSGAPGVPLLLPVAIRDEAPHAAVVPSDATPPTQILHAATPAPAGVIHLQFPKAQLRVEGSVDVATLRAVLECLLR